MLLTLAFLCIPGNLRAMNAFKQGFQQFKQCFTWKKAAALGFAGSCTLAQYGIAYSDYNHFVPLENLFTDHEKEFEIFPNASPVVESFIRKQLMGSKIQQDSLKIKLWNNWRSSHTKNTDWLFVPDKEVAALEFILDEKNRNNNISTVARKNNGREVKMTLSDCKKQSAAIIHHEAGHIINHDVEKRKFVALALPIACAALSFGARKKFIPNNRYWIKNLSKILSGIIIGDLSPCAYYQYCKFQELRADDNVPDNIHLLEAKKQDRMNNLFLNEDEHKTREIWYKNLFLDHPHPKVRIKRLEQRIEALKQKGDPEAFRDPFEIKEQDPKS